MVFGAKLRQIYSSQEFIVETIDKKAIKKLKLIWKHNMTVLEKLDTYWKWWIRIILKWVSVLI